MTLYSIDIDIGGTFTDGFFTDGKDVRTDKVLTTPHDITEGFMACVQAGARAWNLELAEFLRRTGVARVSTTVGTNLLVQRYRSLSWKGPASSRMSSTFRWMHLPPKRWRRPD